MFTAFVSIVLVLIGIGLLIVGVGLFIAFRYGLRFFDQSLKSQLAATGQQQVELAAAKIPNKWVREFILRHLVQAGGALAVSSARGALQSRMRTGLSVAILGGLVLVSAMFAWAWLPLIYSA